jgi:hypothetical protein
MRNLVFLIGLALPAIGWAADDVVWAVSETASTRFADRDVVGPTFKASTRLEVLVRDGDRLRVHDGDEFGWVAKAATTDVAPADSLGGGFDPEAMRRQLEAMGLGGMVSGAPGAPSSIPQVPSPVPSTPPPAPTGK